MELILPAIILIFLIIPTVLAINIPIYKKHRGAGGGTVNHDAYMRKFVYKIPMTGEEIIRTLKFHSELDELTCKFEPDGSVITFYEYGSHRKYYFQISEFEGFSVLNLEQVTLLGMQSGVPYKLNPFMISKLQAEIVPFSQYDRSN